ncbi:DMT family transporter [uncultured Bartonella sp.]|uniref:DMT family transporter n=1 Tax=uncultured Bartonella sp. TaxID=104108 RepID=UPI002620F941|nr:DMT family transporter [uncultured Bartonella sp.]
MFYGVFLSFASYAAYAISDACVKFIDGTLPPYETAFYGALVGIIVIPFLKTGNDRWIDVILSQNWPMWLLRTISGAFGVIGSVTAFTHLAMAEAFTLIFLQPIFVSLLSMVFLKEPIGWRRWSAIVIGFLGVLVVLRPGFRELNIGHLGAIIAGLSGAISIIIVRHQGGREKRITLYSSGIIGTIIICGILSIPAYVKPQAVEWLYLAGYGLFAALGAICLMAAARRVPAIAIATPQYSQMIWAILFGYFIFHDHLDLPMAIGILLIIASSMLTFLREKRRRPNNGLAKPL